MTQGHCGNKWWGQDFNSGRLALEPVLLLNTEESLKFKAKNRSKERLSARRTRRLKKIGKVLQEARCGINQSKWFRTQL